MVQKYGLSFCFEPYCSFPFESGRVLWPPEISALMCYSFPHPTHSRYHSFHFNKYFISVNTYREWTLCKHRVRHWGSDVNQLPSLLSWLLQLPPSDLPVFTPVFFQAVPCIAAGVTASNHKSDLVTLAAVPTAFRGKLGSRTGSARGQCMIGPFCVFQPLLPPGSSAWASVFSPTNLLLVCQKRLSSSLLRIWNAWFSLLEGSCFSLSPG